MAFSKENDTQENDTWLKRYKLEFHNENCTRQNDTQHIDTNENDKLER